ncbi:scarecrow-like protein 30 [Tanacetum coccineum]|uniref:Scarecrow-like protein 30 n=1 Tax=Tanacetum coccineum TaxID=301880 RepID=A0ABQ4YXZ0_9ASTR
MDARLKTEYGLLNLNTMKCDEYNEYASILSDETFLKAVSLNESFIDWNSINRPMRLPDSVPSSSMPIYCLKDEVDVHEDSDFSDLVLKYITQMLMEEDIEDKNCMFQESAALQAAEKSFYNVLMVNEPPCDSTNAAAEPVGGSHLSCDVSESSSLPFYSTLQPSYSSLCSGSSSSSFVDVHVDSPVSILSFPDRFHDNRSRVFPNGNGVLDIGSRGKKNLHSIDLADDGRSLKHSAVYTEPTVRSKIFDELLLCDGAKQHPSQCEYVKKEIIEVQPKGSKGRGKKQGGKKEVVDLRTLLSLCAQSVSTNDQRGVTDLLKRIREHASPTGDGMQRLAHYFSAGLEARMAGSGTAIYKALLTKPTSAVDVLKAYHLFLGCFPFIRVSHFVANKTIMQIAQNKKKLHIIDFGIYYGFQWPSLIQRLSTRPGGPPELRITGIDYPCPGFRPSQRVEETGRRLANYAETFGVKFEFKAIAQKWESIRLEDLELDSEETLVVNCAYRFRNLLDETVIVDSPRNKVLELIRKMNPQIFIQGIVNGSYSAPFFLTRFREALFFYSSVFDMLEATVNRETEERILVEKELWGREAMNVIACEGGERIERPETYKQWQVRNRRAGFCQILLDPEILKMAKNRAKSGYHKDFMIDEDGHWLLQGWKGRILYAISAWRPAY